MTDPIEEAEALVRALDASDHARVAALIPEWPRMFRALLTTARADREALAASEAFAEVVRHQLDADGDEPTLDAIRRLRDRLAAVTAERDAARRAAEVHCAGKINAWAERDRAESALAAAVESDAESLSMYRRARDRAEAAESALAAAREALPTADERFALASIYAAAVEHATGGGAHRATAAADRELADVRECFRRLDAYRAAHPTTETGGSDG